MSQIYRRLKKSGTQPPDREKASPRYVIPLDAGDSPGSGGTAAAAPASPAAPSAGAAAPETPASAPRRTPTLVSQARAAAASAKGWYLRRDGTMFGPVALDVLLDWAAQCRVAPSDELSQDQRRWIPAVQVDELDMNWIVDAADGTRYGPLNRMAIALMIQDGSLTTASIITNRRTGKQISAEDLAPPARQSEPHPPGEQPPNQVRQRLSHLRHGS